MRITSLRRGPLVLVVLGSVAVPAAVILIVNLRRPPQIGADGDVFKTVDALFTAVTARDEKLLVQCETRLRDLKDAGKLPDRAANYLDDIVKTTRRGRWESAAEKLYRFMLAQRRDGAHDHSPKK